MTWNNQTLRKYSSDQYLKSYVLYFFNCLGNNFPVEAHYKNLEELVPKHPPDGIIVHQHFLCISTAVDPPQKKNIRSTEPNEEKTFGGSQQTFGGLPKKSCFHPVSRVGIHE